MELANMQKKPIYIAWALCIESVMLFWKLAVLKYVRLLW